MLMLATTGSPHNSINDRSLRCNKMRFLIPRNHPLHLLFKSCLVILDVKQVLADAHQ